MVLTIVLQQLMMVFLFVLVIKCVHALRNLTVFIRNTIHAKL